MNTPPPWMERPTVLGQIGKAIVLALITIVMVLPFAYVVAVSLGNPTDVSAGAPLLLPQNPTLQAYRIVLGSGIAVRALGISVGVTTIGTALNMVLTATLAYALSQPRVPGSRIVLGMVLVTLLFTPGLIPNYLLVKELDLLNSYLAVILPGAINAFNLVVLRSFFMAVPQDLIDSARMDGASDIRVLLSIVLPLSRASLAAIALFYGVAHWNEFFMATLYLNDSAMWPIQPVLRQYVLQGTALAASAELDASQLPPPRSIQMAVVVIATVPILLVYPILQKYFTKGVLLGAIKG
jgi:putative aldouronate transport system permease protein